MSPENKNDKLHFPTLVSVVIPAHNAEKWISYQMEALGKQSYMDPWEVIIADNMCTDRTVQRAIAWRSQLPSVRVAQAYERLGVSHARNVGGTAASGDLLIFCDADDVATPNWLEELAKAAKAADLVGGYLDFNALNSSSVRSWRPRRLPRDRLPTFMNFLPYATGTNFGVSASVFRALEGFNESYPYGNEEIEFCWRAQLSSYVLAFAPDAVMKYRLRSELWPLVQQGYAYGKSDAQLFRDFKDHGISSSGFCAAALAWASLARRLPELASSERAGGWLYQASIRLGRLAGSVRYGVFYP